MHQTITRFAPSPTGYLHLGHIVNAIFVWGVGRALNAKIILRIEDHDRGRYRREYEEAILRDLEWLGLQPDEGVASVGTPSPFRQSDRIEAYENAVQLLRQKSLVYYCDCSRKSIAMAHPVEPGQEALYPGTCRTLGKTSGGIRFHLPHTKPVTFVDRWLGVQTQYPTQQCGDFLLQERSGSFTYQHCVVVDDHDQGVNLIIRGMDILSSTGRQILLRDALYTKPLAQEFLHHPLIYDEKGEKLSKRKRSDAIAAAREDGTPPAVIIKEAFRLLNLPGTEKVASLTDAILYFQQSDKLPKADV